MALNAVYYIKCLLLHLIQNSNGCHKVTEITG